MASKEARLILRLVDGVSGPAKEITGALGRVNAATTRLSRMATLPGRAIKETGRHFKRATQGMSAFSGAITLGAGAAMRQVFDLEKQLNISMAAGKLTLQQRQAVMDKAVDLNKDYAATSSEIVGGMNELLKAGLGFDTAMGAINGVLDSAQAMGEPISLASDAIVNAMVQLRLPMSTTEEAFASSRRMADLFAYAVNETTASLEDFAISGKYFNPVAAAIGMTAEEAMGLQIALANAGIKGSSAGTGLRSAPVSIAAPTKKGRAAFASLGIDPSKFVKGGKAGAASGSSVAAVLESQGLNAEGIEDAIDQMIKDPKFKKSPAKLANAIINQFGDDLGIVTAEDRSRIQNAVQNHIMKGVKQVDLVGVLKALKKAGAGLAEYDAIFGKQHASKIMALDPEDAAAYIRRVNEEAAGTAKTMREAMMYGIVGQWNELTAAVEKFSVALGKSGLLEDFAAGMGKLAKAVSDLVSRTPGCFASAPTPPWRSPASPRSAGFSKVSAQLCPRRQPDRHRGRRSRHDRLPQLGLDLPGGSRFRRRLFTVR